MNNDVAMLEVLLDALTFACKLFVELETRSFQGMWATAVEHPTHYVNRRVKFIRKAFLSYPNVDRGNSPLHSACAVGAVDATRWLLQHEATETLLNSEQLDPVCMVCSFFRAGKDVSAFAQKAVDAGAGGAGMYSGKLCLEELLNFFGNKCINKETIFGTTALHLAARSGADELVHVLLKAGADPFQTPSSSKVKGKKLTPLQTAQAEGHSSTAAILQKAMDEISAAHAKIVDENFLEDEYLLVPPSTESQKKKKKKKAKSEEVEEAKLEQAKKEQEAREREEAERIAKEKAEAERIAKEKAEAERIAKEKAEAERIAKEKAEAERIAKRKAEAERIAKRKAEAERIAKEKAAEKERIAKEKAAEKERIAKQKAAEWEKSETERIAKEKAERARIAKEKAEKERLDKKQKALANAHDEDSPPSVLGERTQLKASALRKDSQASTSSDEDTGDIIPPQLVEYAIEQGPFALTQQDGLLRNTSPLSAAEILRRKRAGQRETAFDEQRNAEADKDELEPEWASEEVPRRLMDHSEMVMPQLKYEDDIDDHTEPPMEGYQFPWARVPMSVLSSEGVPLIERAPAAPAAGVEYSETAYSPWDRNIFTAQVEPDWNALSWVARASERMELVHLEACASGLNCGHVLGIDIEQLSFGQLDSLEEVHRELLARITDARVNLARQQARVAVLEEMAIAEAQRSFKMLSEFERPRG